MANRGIRFLSPSLIAVHVIFKDKGTVQGATVSWPAAETSCVHQQERMQIQGRNLVDVMETHGRIYFI